MPGPLSTNWQPDASFCEKHANAELNKNLTSLPAVSKEMDMGPLNGPAHLRFGRDHGWRGGCPSCGCALDVRSDAAKASGSTNESTPRRRLWSVEAWRRWSDDGVWRFTVKARDVEEVY